MWIPQVCAWGSLAFVSNRTLLPNVALCREVFLCGAHVFLSARCPYTNTALTIFKEMAGRKFRFEPHRGKNEESITSSRTRAPRLMKLWITLSDFFCVVY